jgi:hypothetical protein
MDMIEAEGEKEQLGRDVTTEVPSQALPIAAYNPDTDSLMEIEDAGGEAEEGTTGMITSEEAGVVDQSSQSSNQVLVHKEGGGHRFVDKDKWSCLVVKETKGYRTIEGSEESMGLGEAVADVREGEQNKKQALISLEQKQMESEQED